VISISGEGMPVPEYSSEKGDLLVTVHVVFPTQLSDEQKSLVKKAFEK
jgi:DnaJ-class molecular chaperone